MARIRFVVLAVILFVGLVAMAATIYSRSTANTTTKVDVDKVARSARKHHARPLERGLRPQPGTYTYEVSGTEGVDVLGGAKHTFGPEAPAVVELRGTGCEWSMELIYAKEHDVTYTYCTDARGTRLVDTNTVVKFFGHEERVEQPCAKGGADAWLVRTGAAADAHIAPFTCRNDERSTTHRPSRAGAGTPPHIAGIDPSTLTFVNDAIVVGASAHGTNPIATWFAPSGLPVSIHEVSHVKSGSILGETNYSLDIRAQLKSATPK